MIWIVCGCGLTLRDCLCLSSGYKLNTGPYECQWGVNMLLTHKFNKQVKTTHGGMPTSCMHSLEVHPSTAPENPCCRHVCASPLVKWKRKRNSFFVESHLWNGIGEWEAEASEDMERNTSQLFQPHSREKKRWMPAFLKDISVIWTQNLQFQIDSNSIFHIDNRYATSYNKILF